MKKCESNNNKSIALNASFAKNEKKEVKQVYISKLNAIRESQVIFLMIANNKNWYYLSKKLHALLRGIK